MTNEQFEKANELKKKIDKLEHFIFFAKRDGWWGKLIKKSKRLVFRETIHGLTDGTEYKLSKDLEMKIVNVLEYELSKMKRDLEDI